MANNRINRYIGAFALGTVLMAVPGCTDTWDDHYDFNASSPETKATLWERIKSNPDYSRFADIVQRAKFYKDDTHEVPDYTFADVLSSGQVNTVWAPDNSVFTDAEYQKWSQMLESESKTDGFNVQQQFLGNHIALWRHNISGSRIDTVKMINGKNLVFDMEDPENFTLQGIPLKEGESGDAYNIAAVNGVLHTLMGTAPFHYNSYEYLKYSDPQTKFGKYVVGKDTVYFSSARSIEGLPDENGNPTYVDSVYLTSNRLFNYTNYLPSEGAEKWQMIEKGFGAPVNNEDSVFIVLMPTDAAWDAAYEMLKESYVYATSYDDKSKGDLNASTTIKDLDADSLQKTSIEMDLVSPLVFNLHKQPKKLGGSSTESWTLETFKEAMQTGENPEYLLNTYGDTLRAVGEWKPSDLFNVEPLDMSNGLAYEVTSWNFPSEFYTPDVEVEIENSGIFYNIDYNNKYKVGSLTKRYSFSNDAYKDFTSVYGSVGNNNFYHLDSPTANSVPKAEIKLYGNTSSAYVPNARVMSGKYDIQLVVVPHWYIDLTNSDDLYKFYKLDTIYNDPEDPTDITVVRTSELNTAYIEKQASMYKYKFRTQISYNDGKKVNQTSSWVSNTSDGLKVDTITVASDFVFPYSYKNLRYSYPTLIFEGQTAKKDAQNGFTYDIVIDKVILKRKN